MQAKEGDHCRSGDQSGMEWPPRGERYVALQIGFDAITSFNELITTVHKFNNDSFTFNDFISRARSFAGVVVGYCDCVGGFLSRFLPRQQKHKN